MPPFASPTSKRWMGHSIYRGDPASPPALYRTLRQNCTQQPLALWWCRQKLDDLEIWIIILRMLLSDYPWMLDQVVNQKPQAPRCQYGWCSFSAGKDQARKVDQGALGTHTLQCSRQTAEEKPCCTCSLHRRHMVKVLVHANKCLVLHHLNRGYLLKGKNTVRALYHICPDYKVAKCSTFSAFRAGTECSQGSWMQVQEVRTNIAVAQHTEKDRFTTPGMSIRLLQQHVRRLIDGWLEVIYTWTQLLWESRHFCYRYIIVNTFILFGIFIYWMIWLHVNAFPRSAEVIN